MTLSCAIHAHGHDQKSLHESVEAILGTTTLCSMATAKGSLPYINTAFFAWSSDLHIYFLSKPTRQHSVNLDNNPTISLTVFDGSQSFGSLLKGLQIFGKCVLAMGTQANQAFDVYTKRFPKLLEQIPSFEDYERSVIQSRLYAVTAESIKIFDEPRFGKDVYIEASINRTSKVLEGLKSETPF